MNWRNEAKRFYDMETSLDANASRNRLEAIEATLRHLSELPFVPEDGEAFVRDAEMFLKLEESRTATATRARALLASAGFAWKQGLWKKAASLVDTIDAQPASQKDVDQDQLNHLRALTRIRDNDIAALDSIPDNEERRSCLLALGRFEEATQEAPEGNPAFAMNVSKWYQPLSHAALSGDWLPLVRFLSSRDADATPARKLLAWSWMTAFGAFDMRGRLPLPASIRKSGFLIAEAPASLRELYDIAFALQQFDSRKPDTEAALEYLRSILLTAQEKSSLELEMVTLYSVFQLARMSGFDAVADEACRRIAERALAASGGTTADPWTLMAPSTNEKNEIDQRSRLLTLGASVSARVVVARIRQAFASSGQAAKLRDTAVSNIARIINAHCLQGHGILQKLIQNAATVPGLVPTELVDRLNPRSIKGRRIATEDVFRILDEGCPNWRATFPEFESTPFAFGAIGQVHCARGEQGSYAVKIRYPGVDSAIKKEFSALKNLGWLIRSVLPELQWQAFIDHWSKVILAECDYRRELNSQEACRSILEKLPGEHVRIPRIDQTLSNERVLVKHWVQAENLEQSLLDAPVSERNLAGRKLLRSTWALMMHGYFNNDVHPGNYLYDGKDIWMFDFGACVSPLDGPGVQLPKLVYLLREGRDEEAARLQITAGFYPDGSDLRSLVDKQRSVFVKPFLLDEEFTFTPDFAANVVRHAVEEARMRRATLPQKSNLAIVNFFGSFYSMLGRIGVTTNCYRLAREIEEQSGVNFHA